MQQVKFKPTRFLDGRKSNSSLEFNKTYNGAYNAKNDSVYYQDGLDQWVFYPGETFEVINTERAS